MEYIKIRLIFNSMIRRKFYILQLKRFVRHYEYFFGIWHQTYYDLFLFKSFCWIVLLYMWQFQLRTMFWSNFTKACHEILDLYEWFCDQKRSGCCIVCKGSYHCKICRNFRLFARNSIWRTVTKPFFITRHTLYFCNELHFLYRRKQL